ncbi:cupin-like domain-containing protein [Sphingobium sp. HBC34]|uniref:Cupin-like domain-containing protein n=1 Tax=Sphingobium cyanobacteriorum TaxID=3063954 RepID=A0ABT8ZPD8_9SPHN|nr:cupin-like domain-containing protein [Sphingobium sp. HBC34]MDO7836397.1 cupin-like domain-containing protein [Sphingobium sp. HBC34]
MTDLSELSASDVCGAHGLRALALACKPAVIRGLCSNWPSTLAGLRGPEAAMAYIGQFAAGRAAEYFSAPSALGGRYHYGEALAGFNFTRETIRVGAALERISANVLKPDETGYLGSLPADAYFPGFAEDNPIDLFDRDGRPRLWLGNPSTVACHYDSYDNLACVVAGRRRFTLYPPEAIGDLYVGPIDHTLSGQPISLAAGAPDGAGAFPRFAAAQAKAVVAILEPGDALYLPKLWWHQVDALDPVNILVNYWWDGFSSGPDSPYASLLLAMIAIAERPAAERAAWRSYFDHYVFRPDGHPLAHLPEAQHGILGPLAQGSYGRIRALVMKMLRHG